MWIAVTAVSTGSVFAQAPLSESRTHRHAPDVAQQPGMSVDRVPNKDWLGANKGPTIQSAPAPVYKTVGRDFYLVFLSAVGSDGPGTDSSFRKIFISSRSVTPVTVSLMRGIWSLSTYTDPNRLTEINIPNFATLNGGEYDIAYNLVIHVQAEDLVAVYAMSHNWLSSDGYLALPVESLGQHYVIASLRNALNYYGGYSPGDVTPRSEFAIAATVDNTNVNFTLTADSYGGRFKRGVPYQVTLRRGQVLPILARDEGFIGLLKTLQTILVYDTTTNSLRSVVDTVAVLGYTGAAPGNDCDLSGSIVTADQPIAVFSGHERAGAPDSLEFDVPRFLTGRMSRDHVCEQLPPMELWGQHFTVVSSGQDHTRLRPPGGDMVRVFAGVDSTVVTVNGAIATTLQVGTWYQFQAGLMSSVETSKPAMVVKYELTAGADASLPGDPDMTVVQPTENMSTYYTIPNILDAAAFNEHHLTLIVDTSVVTQTSWNGKYLPKNIPLHQIPGSPYAWTIFDVTTGQQHVESPRPCYAETFGFGTFDSYTFAGGGNFKYTDSLYAVDLNFDTILNHSAKDSVTAVYSAYMVNDLVDTITVYRFSWERWDSSAFDMLDNNFSPFQLAPGASLPVHFRFHPNQEGPDSALVRVWSSSTKNVFIKLLGNGVDPNDTVFPPVLDFGRVRLTVKRDSFFTIRSTGGVNAAVTINPQDYSAAQPLGFTIDPILISAPYPPGAVKAINVSFVPNAEGFVQYRANVTSNAVPPNDKQSVLIKGRGVFPRLAKANHDFGKVRVAKTSPIGTIAVPNVGTDTTDLFSISIVSGNAAAFKLLDVIPVANPVFLDTAGVLRSQWSYHATFTPTKLGPDTAIVKIVGELQNIFDTLYGVGVEPYVIATPPVINFGTIMAPRLPTLLTDADTTRFNSITNTGSMQALIDSLQFTDTTDFHFAFRILNDPNRIFLHLDTLPEVTNSNTFAGTVHFSVRNIGDFYDTVGIVNDSRNQPVEYVVAKVRVDHADFGPRAYELGTITGCDSINSTITIRNPYGIPIIFDSISLSGNSGGFELEKFIFPIRIAARDSFHVNVSYQLPLDSLNGDQRMVLTLFGKSGGDAPSLIDTFVFHLVRKIQILNAFAIRPSFTPSAGDAMPFRLPIYLTGDWLHRAELDSFTVFIQFPNDVFEPVGIDRTNSISQRLASEPDNSALSWDPVSRIYTIRLVGQHLSKITDQSNTLLLTVLMKAFITPDTTSIVHTWLETAIRPCGFRFVKTPDTLYYANDCGDQTTRRFLQKQIPFFEVAAPHPNPADARSSDGIEVPFTAGRDILLSWNLTDIKGNMLGSSSGVHYAAGAQSFHIGAEKLKSSGAAFLHLEATDVLSGAKISASTKIDIVK